MRGQSAKGTLNDNDILNLFFMRNEDAINETNQKYGKYCYAISYNILLSNEDAEECVNDTCLKAWNSIPPKRPERFSAYLGKICRNLSLNRFKMRKTQKRGKGEFELILSELNDIVKDKMNVEKEAEEKELTKAIEKFLYSVSEEKRNIFIRRYWYMEPCTLIAKRFDIKEGTVRSILSRLRKELKEYFIKEEIEL